MDSKAKAEAFKARLAARPAVPEYVHVPIGRQELAPREEGDEKLYYINYCVVCCCNKDTTRHPDGHDPNIWIFECPTCEDGFICEGCLPEYIGYKDILKLGNSTAETIRCPVCRLSNWRLYHDWFISELMGVPPENQKMTPALRLFYRNRYAEWNCESCEDVVHHLPAREDGDSLLLCRSCFDEYRGDGTAECVERAYTW